MPTKYAQNTQSMLQYEYKSVYFVCRKPKLTTRTVILSTTGDEIHENGHRFLEEQEEKEQEEKENEKKEVFDVTKEVFDDTNKVFDDTKDDNSDMMDPETN